LGTRADRQNFPIRNRIVAGLSIATLVVESDTKGGSMITARLAGEQGRDVFAIPGRIDQASSRGCNALIRDGVRLATCPEDIIDELKFSGQLEISFDSQPQKPSTSKKTDAPKPTINLSGDEATIYKCFETLDSADVDTISEHTQLPPHKCLPILTMLELKKILVKDAGGTWRKRS
jgi:DNA processing protein